MELKDMIKAVFLFKTPANMTAEERKKWREWWLGPHASLGKRIPGLRKYVISLPLDPLAKPTEGLEQFDGMGEMWFDSIEDQQRPLPEWLAKEIEKDAAKGQMKFMSLRVKMLMEEHIIL
jgi:uncharacterized protein (TIGR02118 family)